MNDSVFAEGRVAVVTGAALGIGRAASRRFAELGMSVCLADLPGFDLDGAGQLVSSASARGEAAVMVQPTDVSDPSQINALQAAVTARFGCVNVLMNNAVTRIGRNQPAALDQWRRAMEINFWGIVEGCRAFLPDMLSAKRAGAHH